MNVIGLREKLCGCNKCIVYPILTANSAYRKDSGKVRVNNELY